MVSLESLMADIFPANFTLEFAYYSFTCTHTNGRPNLTLISNVRLPGQIMKLPP